MQNAEADQPLDRRERDKLRRRERERLRREKERRERDKECEPLDKRSRASRPERVVIGDKVYERNDITALRLGETVRTLDKRDRHGAPFQFFGGVKYRPLPDFDEHILTGIRRQKPLQQPKRRRRR